MKSTIFEKTIMKRYYNATYTNATVGNLVAAITTIVDGIIISRCLSEESMAGYGLAVPVIIIFLALASVFSRGAQQCFYREDGKGEDTIANKYFNTALVIATIMSFVIGAATYFGADNIMVLLKANNLDENIQLACRQYIQGIAIGAPAIFAGFSLNSCMVLDNDKRLSMISMVIMTIVDIVGDIYIVTCTNYGIWGIAVVSSISYYAALIAILPHFFKKDNIFQLGFKFYDKKLIGEIIRLGIPSCANRLFSSIGTIGINVILTSIYANADEMSAISIRNNASSFLLIPGLSLGIATFTIGEIFFGEDDRQSSIELNKYSYKRMILATSIFTIANFLLADLIVFIYSGNRTNIELAELCMKIFILRIPFQAFLNIYSNYMRVINRDKYYWILYVLDDVVFPISLALLLMKPFGVKGVWAATTICVPLTILVTYIYACIVQKKLVKNMKDYLLIPDSLGVDDEHYYTNEFHAKDAEALEKVVNDCFEFVNDRMGLEEKAHVARIAVELYGSEIEKHGLTSKHTHHIKVRMMYKDDEVKLTIKDDCSAYPLTEEATHDDSKDVMHIQKHSKSIKYNRSNDINRLTIII